jgi:uncharacterized tellurite resistance protein B-like protein
MTPSELKIVKGLVAMAWADGTLAEPEQGMIEGLLWAFDADEDQEKEVLEYAKKKRTLDEDFVVEDFDELERELLLAHAALLTHADGKQTKAEKKLLDRLVEILGIEEGEAKNIIANAKQRAKGGS